MLEDIRNLSEEEISGKKVPVMTETMQEEISSEEENGARHLDKIQRHSLKTALSFDVEQTTR